MIGVLVMAHGELAKHMIASAEMIIGKLSSVGALGIEPHELMDDIRQRLAKSITELDAGKGVIIFTDMFGGTPSNLALAHLEEGKVEVVSGVNIPMLLKVMRERENRGLVELGKFIRDYGQQNIVLASEVLST